MKIVFILIFCLMVMCNSTFAQNSPIVWINNTFNINIDTISNKKGAVGTIRHTFTNKGEDVTFVDYRDYRGNVTKPKETATILSGLPSYKLNLSYFDIRNVRDKNWDTTVVRLIPFYYDGKIYTEKVTCQLTIGKSKLIKYDNFYFDASDTVNQLVKADKNKVQIIHYFTITNIANKAIFCSKQLEVYHHSPSGLRSEGGFVKINPGGSYKIPVYVNPSSYFNYSGQIEIYTDNISEMHNCTIMSKLLPKDK